MTKLTGRIMRPGDYGWDAARMGFAARCNYDDNVPLCVVFCQDAGDVVNAVRWAVDQNVPIRVRSGRHNFQAYSSLVKGGVIIDVSDLNTVKYNGDTGLAEVGSGLDMLELTEKLWDCGVAIPLATGPTVGIGGLVLGGGFGMLTRRHGLTCDSLESVELVDARGELVQASATQEPDLFWACQGAGGGNLGVVTSFTFRPHPVSLVAAFQITWPWAQATEVVDRWQRWAFQADDGISCAVSLTSDKVVTLYGQYTADQGELAQINELLAPLLSGTQPSSVSIQVVPHVLAQRMFFGVDPAHPTWAVRRHDDRQLFKSASAIAFDYLPRSVISEYIAHIENAPPLSAAPSLPSMIQLLGGGGAPSRISPTATAVPHRLAKFIVQYDGYWTAPQDAAPTVEWVSAFRQKMLPHANHAYVNYSDDLLPNWPKQYYGKNLARLMKIKRHYDPNNVFNFEQSIPLV